MYLPGTVCLDNVFMYLPGTVCLDIVSMYLLGTDCFVNTAFVSMATTSRIWPSWAVIYPRSSSWTTLRRRLDIMYVFFLEIKHLLKVLVFSAVKKCEHFNIKDFNENGQSGYKQRYVDELSDI